MRHPTVVGLASLAIAFVLFLFFSAVSFLPSLDWLTDNKQTRPNLLTTVVQLTNSHTHSQPSLSGSYVLANHRRDALDDDTTVLLRRRLASIVGDLTNPSNISLWLGSLNSDGRWPDSDVDYTTGCAARRANWPASEHWQRILIMAGAWHGGYPGAEPWARDPKLRAAIGTAMQYWFKRDMTTVDCMDWGGTPRCPCENPGNTLWNTNWYSNIILVPRLVGRSCLLLGPSLSTTELEACSKITRRAFGTFDINLNGVGYLTGANTLDVAKVGVDCGLLNWNVSMISDAYRRVHDELVIKNTIKADGIRADGSFGQHAGLLYNGNYGKDFSNAVLDYEVVGAGTQYSANAESRTAFETLMDGHAWMIYSNTVTQVLHFDFSALSRFITFPVIDKQASSSIQKNLTRVLELGLLWDSDVLIDFATSLSGVATNANAGGIEGNRMFYANDYMVHRGESYVTTLKMYSSRTLNSECVNTQNPLGFHLSDGTLYTYLRGDEYEDISATWDWDLIPGITTDYRNTPLNCSGSRFGGKENYVGGVSDGQNGIAVMRYTNPSTGLLKWQKTWFFLENDVQHVIVNILASGNDTVPVYSVLDQKRRLGTTILDGKEVPSPTVARVVNPKSIWHDNVGYVFRDSNVNATALTLRSGPQSGNWSTIGTSTQPPITVDLWAAWLQHTDKNRPIEYSIFPGIGLDQFNRRSQQSTIQTIANGRGVNAIYDWATQVAMIVFWSNGNRSVTVARSPGDAPITLTSSANVAVIFDTYTGDVTVSDPSQTLDQATLTFSIGTGNRPVYWGQSGEAKMLAFRLPRGGRGGESMLQTIT